MITANRTFRIFVSSTFSDLVAERNALQQRIFPRLRHLCAQHGARFQAIDLRWGISEEAAVDQQTMNICLGEIKRCQKVSPRPNFILLLGDRYGWRPPPPQVPAQEFQAILDRVYEPTDRALLLEWYRLDENAVPAEYCLQPRQGAMTNYTNWEPVEQRLHRVLETAALKIPLPPGEMIKYTSSATEQEILAGAMGVLDAHDHVFCSLRQIEGLPDNAEGVGYIDLNPDQQCDQVSAARLKDLKNRLQEVMPANVHHYRSKWLGNAITYDHLDQLCEDVYKSLSKVILDELTNLEKMDPLDVEIEAHSIFGRERARVFIGRADALDTIESYLLGWSRHPLGVWGESGAGKSTLMAQAVEQTRQKFPNAIVIFRFIGATPVSSSVRALLESLCNQITRAYGGDPSSIPVEFRDLVNELPIRLSQASVDKPLYIFLDAVDQLSDQDDAQNLSWLPDVLPAGVFIVISTLPGDSKHALQKKLPPENLVVLQPMSRIEGESLLDLWLENAGRKLQAHQYQEVINKFSSNGLPLYLKFAFEEARLWKSYSTSVSLSPDITGIINDLFTRLSNESNHGVMLVSHALGYLGAAKNGLSEDEMLDLLSVDEEVFHDFLDRAYHRPPEDRLPVVLWSRLFMDLSPYLVEREADGTSLLGFYHRQLGEVVQEKYLADKEEINRHTSLANYFSKQPLKLENTSQKLSNLRKLSEQAYQQACAGLAPELVETLTSFDFLYERNANGGPLLMIEDFNLVRVPAVSLSDLSPESIQGLDLIQDALRLAAHVASRDPVLLPGQLLGRLSNYRNQEILTLLEGARSWRNKPWLLPITASLTTAGGPLVFTLTGHSYHVNSVITTSDGRLCVSAGADWSIRVWDLDTGVEVHELKGMAGGIEAIEMTPDDRYVLAGAKALSKGGLLALWDIQSGNIVRKFNGHTKNVHSVSITNGGKKAVSGGSDGMIFIWDVDSGAALKSMRTKSLTTLAVSPDGNYAAAVSETVPGQQPAVTIYDLSNGLIVSAFNLYTAPQEEISSPTGPRMITTANVLLFAPNGRHLVTADRGGMIRIWEVSSGSELLRLEGHSAEVAALTFHPDGIILISGSKDATIRVWDTHSGEVLSILKGHSAGVKALALSSDGRHLFSGSADNTLKVWELDRGTHIGTLDGHNNAVTSITLTPNGNRVLSCSQDKSIKVWDWRLVGRGDSSDMVRHSSAITAMVLSSDGYHGVSGSQDGGLISWDLVSGAGYLLHKANSSIISLNFTSGPGQVVACTQDGNVINLDLIKRTSRITGKVPSSSRITLVEMAGERRLFSSHEDAIKIIQIPGMVKVGELQAGDELRLLWGLTATPDGARVAAIYWSGTLDIWNGISGRQLFSLKAARPQLSITMTPDGRYALTGLNNGELLLWDLTSGQLLSSWKAYDGPGSTSWIPAVAITPDASRAVSGAHDGVIKCWNLLNRETIAKFQGESEIYRCAITSDGHTMMAGEKSGRIHLLRLVE